MNKKFAGVWLDRQKAFLITLANGTETVLRIDSEIESRVRFPGDTKNYSRFGSMLMTPIRKLTERRKHQLTDYFGKIAKCLSEVDEIYIFGPAETKIAFHKELRKNRNLAYRIVKVEPCELITEHQMVAKVKETFQMNDAHLKRKHA